MPLFDELNPEQQTAAAHTEGPLLVLAGAGSGKTKTLTYRIAHLIQNHQVAPGQILAVTFTNKAAAEMRQRVAALLGRNGADRSFMPFLGTFHAICVRILRQEAEAAGLSRQFVIFDSQDSLSAIKQAMRQLAIDEKRYNPQAIRGIISSAKNELIDERVYQNFASGHMQEVAAEVYPIYQRLLRQAQAVDFDDLLLVSVRVLKDQPEILERWRAQFRYILVDEYQDTNHAQYQLIKLLSEPHHNLCVVGDDWQSVYSWRGANFRNILDFERDYPEATVVKLEQNYRSTKPILSAAQNVISQNETRSEKTLWTDYEAGEPVQVHQLANEMEESRRIIDQIAREGHDHRDVAVLYRTNAQSRSLEEAFIRFGVPYQIVGGTRFYERKEIKDVLAYLRLVYQPNDEVSLRRIINVPPRGLGEKSVQMLFDYQARHGLTLEQTLADAGQMDGLSAKARTALQRLQELLQSARDSQLAAGELVEWLVKTSGYRDYVDDGSIQAADRLENVQELISVASQYHDVAEMLEEVALIADLDTMADTPEGVTLMTLHAAKGLEFPVVFMVGMEEGIFPHSRSLYDAEEMEEERRLCYVGMTRAMRTLHLLHANTRMLYGKPMSNPLARFIAEIGEYAADSAHGERSDISEDAAKSPTDLQPGDEVVHPMFGAGTVSVVDEDEITVAFLKAGSKKLSRQYAPLKRP